MKSITQLKLVQKIKQGLFEYCSLFYKINSRYPTVRELNEAFYIPLSSNLQESEEISENIVSSVANILVEQVVARAPKIKVKPKSEVKLDITKPGLSPEARIGIQKGEPLESLGNPQEVVSKMEPWQYTQWAAARQKAIESGAPEFESDITLGLKTTKTPLATPDSKSPEEAEVKSGLATTLDRVGEIRTGEESAETMTDKFMVAIDNITNWLSTGKEPIAGKDIQSPVIEPPEAPPEEEVEEIPSKEEEEEKIVPSVPDFETIEEPETEEEEETKPRTIPSGKTKTTPEQKTTPEIAPVIPVQQIPQTVIPSRVTKTMPSVKTVVSPTPGPVTPPQQKITPPPQITTIQTQDPQEQTKPAESKEQIKPAIPDYTPKKSKSEVEEEDYPALRAGIEGISIVRSRRLTEGVYDPKKSISKKEKKQKFKVVVIKEGGKKVEIFASSIRGVKRIIFNQNNFKVYNQSGSEMTSYFKKLKGKNK